MQVEISRRKFLKGSVALMVISAAGLSGTADLLAETVGSKASVAAGRGRRHVPTLCEMCVNKCAAIAHIEDDIVKKLEPNPLFPKSRNMLCARGQAGIHALYDPDRLKFPLIRVGERGDGRYRRATWDEAYSHISEKLARIVDEEGDNRSTIGYCAGEGLAEHTFKSFMSDKFGSSNFLNHSTICLQSTVAGHTLTFGGYGIADLENAKYIIMAGANRAEAIVTPDTMDLFKRTRGRGAKLVVVDPRFTNTAMHADTYLSIKPGTDLAFVLALTHTVLNDKLFNQQFVDNNFQDFEKYQHHILDSGYTPEWAEKITGIPAESIRTIARDFMAAAPQAVYYQGRRTTWSKNDFQLRRAMALFTALGGGVDVKGGIVFGHKLPLGDHPVPAPMYANAKPRIDKDAAAVIGATGSWVAWRNMVAEGKVPYPVRGMFVYKQNPMLSVPDTAKTAEMLRKLDLVVVIDTMPSDTAMFADVILPECTYLEREDPVQSFAGIEPAIALRMQAIPAMHESRPVIDIVRGLAEVVTKPLWEISKKHDEDLQSELETRPEDEVFREGGYDLAEPYRKSQEEINHHMVVAKHGEAAWKTLREKGVYYPHMDEYFKKLSANSYQHYPEDKKYYGVLAREGTKPSSLSQGQAAQRAFATPSKKIECFLGSMEKKGIDPMPRWHAEDYVKTTNGKYKFLTGRYAQFTQNATANNAMLLELMKENHAWINEGEARKLGIASGDMVEIVSPVGKVRIKAYPTPKIVAEAIFYAHGFGSKSPMQSLAYGNGASDNEIIEGNIEPVFGSAIMHDTLVTVRKV